MREGRSEWFESFSLRRDNLVSCRPEWLAIVSQKTAELDLFHVLLFSSKRWKIR